MNINELHVDDFGAWHDLTLSDFSKGATVFYGPNEAGKTTLLNLVRTVLYGFSAKRCHKYLPPLQGDRAGGELNVTDLTGGFKLRRTAPANYKGGASFDKFRQVISNQTKQVISSGKAKAVSYRIEIQDGKVAIKAKAENS